MSPCQLSLKKLRSDGWLVAVVERWIPGAEIRQDLFGFADLLAIRGDETLAIQTTTGDHVSHRLDKIRGLPAAGAWLQSTCRKIVIHGWSKRDGPWQCREVFILPSAMNLTDTPGAGIVDMKPPRAKRRAGRQLDFSLAVA